jgi:hypothetical protein
MTLVDEGCRKFLDDGVNCGIDGFLDTCEGRIYKVLSSRCLSLRTWWLHSSLAAKIIVLSMTVMLD